MKERISIVIDNETRTVSLNCEVGVQGLEILRDILRDLIERFGAIAQYEAEREGLQMLREAEDDAR